MASRLPDDHRVNKKQNYWKQPFPKYFEPVNVYEGVIMNGIGGGLLGTIYATFQAMNENHLNVPGRQSYWRLNAKHTAFGAAVPIVFTLGRGLTTNFRQKKDPWNGFIGGAATGLMWGVRFNRHTFGLLSWFVGMGTAGYAWEFFQAGKPDLDFLELNVRERAQVFAKLLPNRRPLDEVYPPPGQGYDYRKAYPGYTHSYADPEYTEKTDYSKVDVSVLNSPQWRKH